MSQSISKNKGGKFCVQDELRISNIGLNVPYEMKVELNGMLKSRSTLIDSAGLNLVSPDIFDELLHLK